MHIGTRRAASSEAGVEHLALVLQRRHRAVDDREERPLRVPASVVGGRREHVHHEGDLRGALHLVLHVLAGVFEQHARGSRGSRSPGAASLALTGGHTKPISSRASATRVGSGDVGGGRRPPLARAVVERGRAGAVEREPGAGAVEHDVAGRVAGAEHAPRAAPLPRPARPAPAAGGRPGSASSTSAPASRRTASAAGLVKRTPARASTSSVASWISVAGGGVEQAQAGDHGAPFVAAPYGTMTRRAPGTM